MSLTKEDLDKISRLAMIDLASCSKDLQSSLLFDLQNIMDMIKKIKQVPTDDVTPMAHPIDVFQRLRSDVVTEVDVKSDMQAIAPETDEDIGLYLVPKVVE